MATEIGSQADRAKIAAIRDELPAVRKYIYLNTGTNGPLPRRSHEAMEACAMDELLEGRIGPEAFARTQAIFAGTRAAVAALLGCDPDEIALTHNTTEGLNIALMGLDWQRGDEIVTAATEHPGGLYPIYLLRQRYGVKIRMTDIGLKDLNPVAALQNVLSPKTKAVVLSHVSWTTGMVLPIRELADLTHSAGALFICDAAQACGMVPSNVYELGIDAYACSGQKWLCGPDGTGALFVRKDRLGEIQQTYIGYRGIRPGMCDHEGHFVPAEGAHRYEATSLYPPAVKALGVSIDWLANELGWNWIYARIAALGQYCYDALAAVDGVMLHTPRKQMAGLVHFSVAGITPADLTTKLCKRGIIIRHTPHPPANRVSIGFYNTEAEVNQLVEAIAEICKFTSS
jgi:L-cysteine/cystine lyase